MEVKTLREVIEISLQVRLHLEQHILRWKVPNEEEIKELQALLLKFEKYVLPVVSEFITNRLLASQEQLMEYYGQLWRIFTAHLYDGELNKFKTELFQERNNKASEHIYQALNQALETYETSFSRSGFMLTTALMSSYPDREELLKLNLPMPNNDEEREEVPRTFGDFVKIKASKDVNAKLLYMKDVGIIDALELDEEKKYKNPVNRRMAEALCYLIKSPDSVGHVAGVWPRLKSGSTKYTANTPYTLGAVNEAIEMLENTGRKPTDDLLKAQEVLEMRNSENKAKQKNKPSQKK